MTMKAPPILFDEGWSFMQTGIRQLMTILEGEQEPHFNYEQYMIYYTTIYNMCFQMHPYDYSQQLYDKYKETFVEYINLMVLPSLREKHDEFMLRELVKCWSNHKVMLRWLRWIFQYLDRYFIHKRSLPSLREVGLTCFRDSVYEETKGRAKDAVIVLINQEREGGQIDRELLKNVLGIYVEIGMGKMDYYEKDFEAFMLADSAKYYARKVSNWIKKDSCPDYMLKADDCLNKENHIVDHYLHSSSRPKLIEEVKNNFLFYISQLLKKEHWCCTLLRDDKVNEETKGRAKGAMLALINQEREGEKIDRKLLHVLGISFKIFGMGQMDCYKDFEAFMLADSADYYARKASNWIKEDSCPDYMLKAEDHLNKENHIVGRYLHSSSWPKLIEKVQNELLVNYSSQLLEKEQSGCRTLLRDDKVDDLTRMYKLFSKIPKGLDPVANMFKQHVTAEGMTLVQQADDAASNKSENVGGPQEQVFFRKVIDLHDKFMAYVTDCFSNHNLFHKALKEAFEVFCNKTVAGCSCAELLSAYCDNILKKGGSEKLSDEAIEETLDKVVKLLAYINDKVLFVEFYRKKLSRRLLFYKSANDDHERLILSKLKQHCGGHFTSKMEGMVTDLALAKENHSQFNEYLSNNPVATPGIDLTVTVLTTCFWPSYKSSDLCLPVEMVKCVEVFKEFYQTKTKNRKLTWIYSLGTCNVNGLFNQKTIELILGTYQAAALLLFNASEKLSYTEIKTQLNLADDDVVRLLQSLSCAKYKILTKVPSSRTVSETDVFQFNSKFTDRMRRIRIPLAPVDERKKVVENVDKDRRYAIDASIVRIMKSRKVLNYQQLVSECMEQLGRMFKPDVKVIKKRIEDLITREYLERDKENPQQFRYLT